MKTTLKRSAVLASALALALGASACGSGGSSDAASSSKAQPVAVKSIDAALTDTSKTVTLTTWAWSYDTMKPSIQAFEKKYPHIKINFVNTSSSANHYTKFQNVLKAKKGVPDVVQLEYESLPQYAVTGSLLNFESSEIEKDWAPLYNKAAWKGVHVGQGLYGVPQDQGPLAMFYRKDLLDKYGITPPTTWQEYEKAGIELHKKNPSLYMGFIDTSGQRQFLTMLRQADATPWKVNNETSVQLGLTSSKVKQVATFVQKLIDEDVLDATPGGTDAFNRAMDSGRYATYIDGSWRGGLLETGIPSQKGDWRAAEPPAWGSSASDLRSAEAGGSVMAVTASASTEKRAAALAFINWLNSDKTSIDAFQTTGGSAFFNAANAYQNDSSRSTVKAPYFGDQEVNKIYTSSAKAVNTNWSWLPFNSESDTEFHDIVVPQMKKGGDIAGSLAKWQSTMKSYASGQGFTVSTGDGQ